MKCVLQSILIALLLIALVFSVHADGTQPRGIILDRTIGITEEPKLQGPDYDIKAEYGHQTGANLFHSFQQFNIHSDESATFKGPASVQNIISRVTGGNPSWIDGTLRSTIKEADIYFFNPTGMIFGPNAALDISGSFHVSTADYLRMGESEQFFSVPLKDETLSAASPTAFGFLLSNTDEGGIATISFQGKGEITAEEWDGRPAAFTVPEGETISVIGGDIKIKQGTYFRTVDDDGNTETTVLGNLNAPEGQINLVSTTSKGEVALTSSSPDISCENLGRITLSDKSVLDVSGNGGGSIFIRGGRFVASDSIIRSNTLANKDGSVIDVKTDEILFNDSTQIEAVTQGTGKGSDVTLKAGNSAILSGETSVGEVTTIALETNSKEEDAGNAGTLFIEAKNILFEDGARAINRTQGKGNGGDIIIQAEQNFSLTGESSKGHFSTLQAITHPLSNGGEGGDIKADAENILLTDGALIATLAIGTGKSGDITAHATGMVTVTGASGFGQASSILSASNALVEGIVSGDGGVVSIETGELILKDGGMIASTSLAIIEGKSSDAGDVRIKVHGTTQLTGVNLYGENQVGFGSGIYTSSRGTEDNTGDAGEISLETGSLIIEDGAVITSSTNCNAQSKKIEITAHETVQIAGDSSNIELNPPGITQINYQEQFARYEQRDSVSGIYAASESENAEAGRCGDITLTTPTLTLAQKGIISTSGAGGGDAGSITLNVNTLNSDTGAVISSKSESVNFYTVADITERNLRFALSGDVAEITKSGENKSERHIYTGDEWIRLNQNYYVADADELSALADQYALVEGDRAEMTNAGETAIFIYSSENWLKLRDNGHTVNDMSELRNLETIGMPGVPLPFPFGEIINVTDTGNGKKGIFYHQDYYGRGGYFERLDHFVVADVNELNDFTDKYALKSGDMVNVRNGSNGQPAVLFYRENAWKQVNMDNIHNTEVLEDIIIPETGTVVKLENPSQENASFIFSGDEWISLKNLYNVGTMSERDKLPAQAGDVAKVTEKDDNGNETIKSFLFSDGTWKETYKSGDAGRIFIENKNAVINIGNNSSITTETQGQGKAGKIYITADEVRLDSGASVSSGSKSEFNGGDAGTLEINANGSIRLSDHSSLATEAKSAGGGDITTKSEFVVLDHSKISADAEQGDGGAIFIHTENYIKSGDSTVTATSHRGNDGTVKIEAPDLDMSSGLTLLPGSLLDAARWMKTPCTERSGENVGSFTIKGRDATPTPLDDVRTSPVMTE